MLCIHLRAFNFPPPVAIWGGYKPDQFLLATMNLFSQCPSNVNGWKTLTRLNACNVVDCDEENNLGHHGWFDVDVS